MNAGASSITDAYLIAITIPNVIYAFIGTGIATGYIPMYSKIESIEGSKESNKFTNNLVNILIIISTSQLLLVLPFAYRKGYRYKPVFDIKDKYIKNMVYIALPVIMGASVNQINVLVDRTMASRVAEGGISALNYANRLNGFVQGIFVLSISTALCPMISGHLV